MSHEDCSAGCLNKGIDLFRRKDKNPVVVSRNVLAKQLGWWTVLCTLILAASLTSNIFALIFPFLEFSAAFQGNETYSIPHTIQLMWSMNLYAIAALIVAFSLTFPFVKLILLTVVLWLPLTQLGRQKTLSTLRQLGRWSLLDVFIALIILVLADDQIFIGAKPQIGVTLFLAAICSSMFTCELLEYLNHRGIPHQHDPLEGRHTPIYWASGWPFWIMIPVIIAAIGSLVAAVSLPFFQISQFLLKDFAYSVLTSIQALDKSGWTAFAITMLAFLVVLPMLRLVMLLILGFVPMNRFMRRLVHHWSGIIGAWSMLDVFGLALLLFLTEGANLVKFNINSGLYVIIGSVALYYLAVSGSAYAIHRVMKRSSMEVKTL